ncbi:phage portal protein [Capnocytophaga canimorsus]|uniref:phage portal protein n=1 Tax=Capnocytophaga canimorsus TaxID=28188 RepID=UPI00384B4C04
MKIEEINQLNVSERIKELTKNASNRPSTETLLKDWDYTLHDVFNDQIRKKRKVQTQPEERNPDGTIKKEAQFKWEEVNRIGLPLEQDITNIHTAFSVGMPPKITCEPQNDNEDEIYQQLLSLHKKNKLRYENKRLVRSWFSECEVAEYWYGRTDAETNKIRLKSVIWSPFRGDTFFPYYDEYGDLIAFTRKYITKDEKENATQKYMVIDKKNVTIYANNEQIDQYPHNFGKIPVIYMKREKPLCDKIRTLRNRLEILLSNFADCLDYNFFPKMMASGQVIGRSEKGTTGEIIELENGGNVSYLTWQQSPDMAKLEFENLTSRCYSLTNTPQISFEALQGMGNALSGRAFKFMFMGTHMAVSNHAETIEEFLQRRINFLISAIASTQPKLKTASETIEVDIEIVPYMIDNLTERITDAVTAVSGGVASRREGVILAGITDQTDEELAQIEKEKKKELFED